MDEVWDLLLRLRERLLTPFNFLNTLLEPES